MPDSPLEDLRRMYEPSNEPNGDYVEEPVRSSVDSSALSIQGKPSRRSDRTPEASVKLETHTIHYESPAGNDSPLPAAMCTCGWSKVHASYQVCFRKATQHSKKTGHVMLSAKA